MKLMDHLDELAGLDMVLLREAGFDPEAEPVQGASPVLTRSPSRLSMLRTALKRLVGVRIRRRGGGRDSPFSPFT